ncbi:RNA-directed DNA polymerase from mobile element jockey-like protein [Pitangus sulphuratus]|nr:RNA-directed DNA polymerase from mobile element jockey-like protein [Pitangus sulphuratus]
MTMRMINSESTLKLCGICCSSWIPANLWGLMGFILESSELLMSSQNLLIFKASWESGEVPADWKLVNVVLVSKKGKKEDPGNYNSVSLTSVPGKVMGKITLGSTGKHLKDNAVTGHSQHGVMRGKSRLSNLISFYNSVNHLVYQGKPVDVMVSDFSKAFNTVSHRILLDKMPSTQLDKRIMWWVSNWLKVKHRG